MFHGYLGLIALMCVPVLEAWVHLLPSLPNAAKPWAIQLDATGNIYVVGSYVPANKSFTSALVAKLTPGASQVAYFKSLAGSNNDVATALALGPDDSVYVTGTTLSADFPVTPGLLQKSPARAQRGLWRNSGEVNALEPPRVCIESFRPLQRMGTPDDCRKRRGISCGGPAGEAAFVSGRHLLITLGAPA